MRTRALIAGLVVIALAFSLLNVFAVPEEVPYGPWVDEVVFFAEPERAKAVDMMEKGEMHAYFIDISDPVLIREKVLPSEVLKVKYGYALYYELTFNPVGPEFPATGELNPFSNPRIREAMNYLIDRHYIVEEIMGGLAVPRWLPITPSFPDYGKLADVCKALEAKYSHNPELAKKIIFEEMRKMGAEFKDGKWYYKGKPVVIKFLIRVEDQRKQIGDYVSSLLEELGFTVERMYKTSKEASPIWLTGDPADGKWHIYTGGWITTVVSRDESDNFGFFYTPLGPNVPLWQAYKPDPEFYEIAKRLYNKEYKSIEERNELMAKALELAMKDSVRVWLVNQKAPFVHRADLEITADLAAGFATDIWAYTIKLKDKIGGTVKIGNSEVLIDPWNPVDPSDWTYDRVIMDVTLDRVCLPDPFTGLYWPQRIVNATVMVPEGTPITKTLDWVELRFVPGLIEVPTDAWFDYDAKERKIVTAPEGTYAKAKVIVNYGDILGKIKYHDGTTMSLADWVFSFILTFDRAKPESPVYDEAYIPDFEAFREVFCGMKILSTSPLVIEYYTNLTYLDAEWLAYDVAEDFYPSIPWHVTAIGWLADSKKLLAFSADKADKLKVEWANYIAGPSLRVLEEQLDEALKTGFIPYKEVLGKYVTVDEAKARYKALKKWYEDKGHFWVGSGPFYLERADYTAHQAVLRAFREFPDKADKWAIFAVPKIPEVELEAPATVVKGGQATFKVWISFKGEPYAIKDIEFVKFLVLDAAGNVVAKGDAKAVKDGLWEAVLTPSMTAQLEVGAYRFYAIALSKLVAMPVSAEASFSVVPGG